MKNLEDVYKLEDLKIKTILSPEEAKRWLVALHTLPADPNELPELKEKVMIGSVQQASWKWGINIRNRLTCTLFGLAEIFLDFQLILLITSIILKIVRETAVILLILWGVSRLALSCGWIRALCPVSLNGTQGIIDFFVDADIRQFFLQWLSGNRALAKSARVNFHWEEPLMVGNTVSFAVEVHYA